MLYLLLRCYIVECSSYKYTTVIVTDTDTDKDLF